MVNQRSADCGLAPSPAFLPSCGDVSAARDCAAMILALSPNEDLPLARLVLSAVCLHLGSQDGPDPTLADVLKYLGGLSRQVGPPAEFLRSPMQFLHYAALELADLPAQVRADTFELSIAATRLAASNCARRSA